MITSKRAEAMAVLRRRAGGTYETVLHGQSMEPGLPDGAEVRIAAPESPNLRIGQIAVFRNSSILTAHRIVYRGESGWILTQGDNSIDCDPPIREENVEGIVVAVRVEDRWQEPKYSPARRSWRKFSAAAYLWTIRACLAVDFRIARFVRAVLSAGVARLGRMRRQLM